MMICVELCPPSHSITEKYEHKQHFGVKALTNPVDYAWTYIFDANEKETASGCNKQTRHILYAGTKEPLVCHCLKQFKSSSRAD